MIAFSGSAMNAKRISITKRASTATPPNISAETADMRMILRSIISRAPVRIVENYFQIQMQPSVQIADNPDAKKQSNGSSPQVKLQLELPSL